MRKSNFIRRSAKQQKANSLELNANCHRKPKANRQKPKLELQKIKKNKILQKIKLILSLHSQQKGKQSESDSRRNKKAKSL